MAERHGGISYTLNSCNIKSVKRKMYPVAFQTSPYIIQSALDIPNTDISKYPLISKGIIDTFPKFISTLFISVYGFLISKFSEIRKFTNFEVSVV